MSTETPLNPFEQTDDGVCAIGSVGLARGIDMSNLDPEEPEAIAAAFNIAPCLAQEIVHENDEGTRRETPEQRWERVRKWALAKLATGSKP